MSIKEAAEKMKVSPQFIRVGLQRGQFPFGVAVKLSGDRFSYHISPKKLNEYIGL